MPFQLPEKARNLIRKKPEYVFAVLTVAVAFVTFAIYALQG